MFGAHGLLDLFILYGLMIKTMGNLTHYSMLVCRYLVFCKYGFIIGCLGSAKFTTQDILLLFG